MMLQAIDGCYLLIVYMIYGFHALRLDRNTCLNNICEWVVMIHVLEMVDRHIFLVEHALRSQSRVGHYT